jgi:hypothetical protein
MLMEQGGHQPDQDPNPISSHERSLLDRLFASREHFQRFHEVNFPDDNPSDRDDLVADLPYWDLVSRLVLITEDLDNQLASLKPNHPRWYNTVQPVPPHDFIARFDPLIDHTLSPDSFEDL